MLMTFLQIVVHRSMLRLPRLNPRAPARNLTKAPESTECSTTAPWAQASGSINR